MHMLNVQYGTHALVVFLEIVGLLFLILLGLTADAYWPRKRLAPATNLPPFRRPAPRTLAGWHRAAWRRANRQAGRTLVLDRVPA